MTNKKIIIIYGDLRQQALYKYLLQLGECVETFSHGKSLSTLHGNNCNFNIIVCPIPFTKNNETIYRSDNSVPDLSISEFIDFVSPGQLIFGGNILLLQFQKQSLSVQNQCLIF